MSATMSATITIKNVSGGGLVLPLGAGLLLASGEEAPVSADEFAKAKKSPVVAAWIADGKLVEGKSAEAEKPAKAPKAVKVEG